LRFIGIHRTILDVSFMDYVYASLFGCMCVFLFIWTRIAMLEHELA
jgi:hypothetical protein